MSTLVIELPDEVLVRLHDEAGRQGQSAQGMVKEWVVERLNTTSTNPTDERQRVLQVLQAAGLLSGWRNSAAHDHDPVTSLEQVRAALDRASGAPLSDIAMEQRGVKV